MAQMGGLNILKHEKTETESLKDRHSILDSPVLNTSTEAKSILLKSRCLASTQKWRRVIFVSNIPSKKINSMLIRFPH